jgi:hypothetical protein
LNDLDRKIAWLKGWEVIGTFNESQWPEVDFFAAPQGLMVKSVETGEIQRLGLWSTSDTKALDLVDEILTACECDFALQITEEKKWIATFGIISRDGDIALKIPGGLKCCFIKDGSAPTRPEAICRAYIAAKEFLNKKGR